MTSKLTAEQIADKIIADYLKHYSFPAQGESHMHDCIVDALDSSLQIPEEPTGWIPVSSGRLPKEGEIVAVSDEDGQLGHGYVERGVLIRASEDLGDIVEWYPLPDRAMLRAKT